MLEHCLAQYADKEVIEAFLSAVATELDSIDSVLYDLKYNRWIDTGSGKQLDGIGTIVSQDRIISDAVAIPFFGFYGQNNTTGFNQARFRSKDESYLSSDTLSDAEYRLVLWAKVSKNNSLGYLEDTIKSVQFIFDTDLVIIQDVGNAKFSIGIGRTITASEKTLAKALDLFIRAGGVSYQFISSFDKDNVFGFSTSKNAKGFGIGKFASIF